MIVAAAAEELGMKSFGTHLGALCTISNGPVKSAGALPMPVNNMVA